MSWSTDAADPLEVAVDKSCTAGSYEWNDLRVGFELVDPVDNWGSKTFLGALLGAHLFFAPARINPTVALKPHIESDPGTKYQS